MKYNFQIFELANDNVVVTIKRMHFSCSKIVGITLANSEFSNWKLFLCYSSFRDAHIVELISDFVTNFQDGEANSSKPRIDMDTMFSQKLALDPGLHFRPCFKISTSWFFAKSFGKNWVFSTFDPMTQNRDRIQSPWFHNLYMGSIGYILA